MVSIQEWLINKKNLIIVMHNRTYTPCYYLYIDDTMIVSIIVY